MGSRMKIYLHLSLVLLLAARVAAADSERDKRSAHAESTAKSKRQAILAEIKKLMLEEPGLEPVTVRTRLVKLSEYSLDLEVFAYVLTRDWLAFLEIQENLLLRIMDIVEASGTSVALPYPTPPYPTPAGPPTAAAAQTAHEVDIRPATADRRRGAPSA